MNVVIGTFRDLLKQINESPKLLEALQQICSSLNVVATLPSLDVETRWNSSWEMISGIIKMRKPIEELQRRIRDRHEGYTSFSISPTDRLAKQISDESWSYMHDFSSFLAPFKDLTVLMSGSEYPTLGMTIPIYHSLTQHSKNAITANTGFRAIYTIKFAKSVM